MVVVVTGQHTATHPRFLLRQFIILQHNARGVIKGMWNSKLICYEITAATLLYNNAILYCGVYERRPALRERQRVEQHEQRGDPWGVNSTPRTVFSILLNLGQDELSSEEKKLNIYIF